MFESRMAECCNDQPALFPPSTEDIVLRPNLTWEYYLPDLPGEAGLKWIIHVQVHQPA